MSKQRPAVLEEKLLMRIIEWNEVSLQLDPELEFNLRRLDEKSWNDRSDLSWIVEDFLSLETHSATVEMFTALVDQRIILPSEAAILYELFKTAKLHLHHNLDFFLNTN